MSFGSVDMSDNMSTYLDSTGRPYTLIRKPFNPTNNPTIAAAGATVLLEQGTTNYGTIQFGGVLTNSTGGGTITSAGGSVWAGKAPTRPNTSGNYYNLGFEMGTTAPVSGGNHAVVFTAFGGIRVLSVTSSGVITDAAGTPMLSFNTLGTGVVNSSLTSVGTLTSLTVNGNVSVKPAANLLRIDATSELVGIGVGTPAYKLDVAGDTNVTGAYKIGGTDVLTSTTLGSSVVNSSLTSVGTLTTLNVTGTVTAANLAGTLTTAAQPNITSVGTLTNVNTSGAYQINGSNFLGSYSSFSIAAGANAGQNSQGQSSVAVGYNAGRNTQGQYAVAVGIAAGITSQSASAVAVGRDAGSSTQGGSAVAVGYNAGNSTQGQNAVAIGVSAGQTSQGNNTVAVGIGAGQTSQSNNAVAVGNNAGITSQGGAAVAIGVVAGQTSQSANTVAVGNSAGQLNQSSSAVAIGLLAAQYTQGASAVAIGPNAAQGTSTAGTGQGANAVAIGNSAGNTTQGASSVSIGLNAGQTSQATNAVAIGNSAGNTTQGTSAVALGQLAGQTNQHANSIILNASGTALNSDGTSRFFVKPIRNNTTATSLLQYDATSGEITYGPSNIAGTLTTAAQPNVTSVGTLTNVNTSGVYRISGTDFIACKNTGSVAVGFGAGSTTQGINCTAVGHFAGNSLQSDGAVAVGRIAGATSQGIDCVAVGNKAGNANQAQNAVALGQQAGLTGQGAAAVAIGARAGETNQHANSIILNASGLALNSDGTSRFYVKPIRNNTAITTLLGYDATSGEITSGATALTPTQTTLNAAPEVLNFTSTTLISTTSLAAGWYDLRVDYNLSVPTVYTNLATRVAILKAGSTVTAQRVTVSYDSQQIENTFSAVVQVNSGDSIQVTGIMVQPGSSGSATVTNTKLVATRLG